MAQSLPVRCPACRREHRYVPPELPCACGAPLTVQSLRGSSPVPVRHRSWEDTWTEVRCPACRRSWPWPRPEFDCSCGVTVRLTPGAAVPRAAAHADEGRQPFQPVTIRTGYDAVSCAAWFLRWLGFPGVRVSVGAQGQGVDLRGPSVVGVVNPTTVPTDAGAVETLWLHALADEAVAVAFSLAGYERQAGRRADQLGLALFTLDLTGTPQPVNDRAEALLRQSTEADPAPD